MKYLIGICYLLIHLSAVCQTTETRTVTPLTDAIAISKSQTIINNFIATVTNILAACKQKLDYDASSMVAKFAAGAIIEVSTLRDTSKRIPYSPERYFNMLKGLCHSTRYDDVDIKFKPDPITAGQISRPFNNICIVTKDITQTFQAFKDGERVYCEVTIKQVGIKFTPQPNGTYKALIDYIKVRATNKCLVEQ